MNFKNLFSWKRAEDGDRPILAAWRADSVAPRPLHYVFAHRLLPQLTYHHGIMAALALGDPDSEFDYLPRLWEATAQHLTPQDSIAPSGLAGTTQRAGEFRITVITCPPPERAGEVYFVAIVCGPLPEEEEAPFRERAKSLQAQILSPPDNYFRLKDAFNSHRMMRGSQITPTRYFTLERTHPENGEFPTMFCAWAPNGEHLNFGNGPQPDRDAFAALVISSLSEPPVLYGGSGPQGLRGADGKIMTEEEVRELEKRVAEQNATPPH